MKLEYIASGLSFIWCNSIQENHDEKFKDEIHSLIDLVNTFDPDFKFGCLFNAYTESQDAQWHNDLFHGHTIQGDSGGLQMITLGGSVTEEEKIKVYETQAKYTTHGMCFDLMPLDIVNTNSSFHDLESRRFSKDRIFECASGTGKNIITQIETYDRLESQCKPYIILQGNCHETFQEWLDVVLATIPSSMHSKIHGLAQGGIGLGMGTLEDIERFVSLSQLEGPDHLLKNFHLLGLGSLNRLESLIAVKHLFTDDQLISFDSTKHTRGAKISGQFQLEEGLVAINSRQRNTKYYNVWHQFDAFQKSVLGFDYSEIEFYDVSMTTVPTRVLDYGVSDTDDGRTKRSRANILRFSLLVFSVWNMHKSLKRMKAGDINPMYKSLSVVHNMDDFNSWYKDYSRFFSSKKVKLSGIDSVLDIDIANIDMELRNKMMKKQKSKPTGNLSEFF
jgi:hypothetical protein